MSGTSKWDDAAVKDLTMAIIMSNNNGNMNISANWDKVQVALLPLSSNGTHVSTETMTSWGYGFSKSAMSQHWSKKIVKQFKERHGDVKGSDNGVDAPKTPKTPKQAATPNKRATPAKRASPKTPLTGRGKKRAAVEEDEETSPETGPVGDTIAKNKTPRSVVKKVKYEEEEDEESDEMEEEDEDEDSNEEEGEEDGEHEEDDVEENKKAMVMDEEIDQLAYEMEAAAEKKAREEGTNFYEF